MAIQMDAASDWISLSPTAGALTTGSFTLIGRARMVADRGTWSFTASVEHASGQMSFLYSFNGSAYKTGINWASNDSTNSVITTLSAGDEFGWALVGTGTTLRAYIRKGSTTYYDDETIGSSTDITRVIIGSNTFDNMNAEFVDVKLFNNVKNQTQIEAEWAAQAVQDSTGLICKGTLSGADLSAALTNQTSNAAWANAWTSTGSPTLTSYSYAYGGGGGSAPSAPVLGTPVVSGNSVTITATSYVAGSTITATVQPGNIVQNFSGGAAATFSSLAIGSYTVSATQTTTGGTSVASTSLSFTISASGTVAVRLVPFGDSLTSGSGPNETSWVSYRGPLFSRLQNGGYSPVFVGPQQSITSNGLTTDHAGWGGATIGPGTDAGNNLSGRVATVAAVAGTPNVIVLMAGANNFNNSTNNYGDTAIAEYQTWINAVTAQWPAAMVVLTVQPPAEYWSVGSTSLNNWTALRNWLAGQANASTSDRLVLCDVVDSFVSADRTDGLHLSAQGADKLAQGIYNTVVANAFLIGGSSSNGDPLTFGTTLAVSATIKAIIASNLSSPANMATAVQAVMGSTWKIRPVKSPNTTVGIVSGTSPLPISGASFLIPISTIVSNTNIFTSDPLTVRLEDATGVHWIDLPTATSGKPGVLSGAVTTGQPISLGVSGNQIHIDFGPYNPGGGGGGGGGSSNLEIPSDSTVANAVNDWMEFTNSNNNSATEQTVGVGTDLDLTGPVFNRVATVNGFKRGLGINYAGFKTLPDDAARNAFVHHVKSRGFTYVRWHEMELFGGGGTAYTANGGGDSTAWYSPSGVMGMIDATMSWSAAGIMYTPGPFRYWNAWGNYGDPFSQTGGPPSVIVEGTANISWAINRWKNVYDILFDTPSARYGTKMSGDPNMVFIEGFNENTVNQTITGWASIGQASCANTANMIAAFNSWSVANGLGTQTSLGNNSTTLRFLIYAANQSQIAMKAYALSKGGNHRFANVNRVPSFAQAQVHADDQGVADWHLYFDLSDSGVGFFNASTVGSGLWHMTNTAIHAIQGLPVASTEYGFNSANQYGHELMINLAFAAYQDLSYIALFVRGSGTDNPRDGSVWSPTWENTVQTGQDMHKDPNMNAAARAGTFFFNRGDVAPAPKRVGFVLRRPKSYESAPWGGDWSRNLHRLALVVGMRTVREAEVSGTGAGATYTGSGPALHKIYDAHNLGIDGDSTATWLSRFKTDGAIPTNNPTNLSSNYFETIDGQIAIQMTSESDNVAPQAGNANSRMTAARVQTNRSHALCWDNPSARMSTSFMVVEKATERSAISAHDISSTLPGLTLSNKILLIHLTESRGSFGGGVAQISYAGSDNYPPAGYASRSVYGVPNNNSGWRNSPPPVYQRRSIIVMKLALAPGNWTLRRLDWKGQYQGTLPVERLNDGMVRMVLDNNGGSGNGQQTTFYSLVLS